MTDIDSSSDLTRPLSVERFEEDRAKARAKGFEIVESDDGTLTVDLDGPCAISSFDDIFERAAELFGLTVIDRWESKSGPGHEHVVVRCDNQPRDVVWRIALQAILGSDPIRELLALKRLENGVAEPSQLFKPFEAQHPEVFKR